MQHQPRLILSLDKTPQTTQARQLLRSPLGLAHEIVRLLFENDFMALNNKLDTIKQFVAGMSRVQSLSPYRLAEYYPFFFAYHQFFHSSYRARQGNVLENLLIEWLKTAPTALDVPHSKKAMQILMRRVLPNYASKLDLDVVVADQNRLLCIQLRSRDDTGGTVAKMSLGEAARYMLRETAIAPNSHIHYVMGIWDVRDRTQETITKSKVYEVLKDDLQIDKDHFFAQVSQGIALRPHVTLQLCYGYTDVARVIAEWTHGLDIADLEHHMAVISQADDLWLAYLVGHLELESLQLYGQDNITRLIQALITHGYDKAHLYQHTTSQACVDYANALASQIAQTWEADFLFLPTLSEKITYIRDLILLKFVYDSLS